MPLRYTIAEIAGFCGGKLIREANPQARISHVLTDSRALVPSGEGLFFALVGEQHNGHRFLSELFDRGITSFVISETESLALLPSEVNVMLVKNTLLALQQFAAAHRRHFAIPVAAVTGSNGKTIVKEWIAQLMSPEKHLLRSPMSYNSQVGVPLSVLQLDEGYDLALFEAGISKPGEMEKLAEVIQPEIGVFTGIGAAHDEHFTGWKQKTLEKLKLFEHASSLICFNDDPDIFPLVQDFAETHQQKLFTIGTTSNSVIRYKILGEKENSTAIEVFYADKWLKFSIPFTDHASVRNGLLALGFMLFLNCDTDTCLRRMSRLEPVAMRMEQVEGLQNCILINDSYNNDLMALRIALEYLSHQQQRPRRTLILSDIFQTGLDTPALISQLADMINTCSPDRFIGIGGTIKGLREKISGETWFYDSTEQFLHYHPVSVFIDEVILLKGARSFRFEQILEHLQKKSHQTILEINLKALVHNLNIFRSKLHSGTSMMAMVKASSYGAGNFEIASVLQYQRVACLAVAYADEGVELRKAGITLPVMVMNPESGAFDQMLAHRLEPEIYSFDLLDAFTHIADKNFQISKSPYPIHIETDTGMNRLGFRREEIPELIRRLKQTPSLQVRTVFSHLATADDPDDDGFAAEQISRFSEIRELLSTEMQPAPLFHLLNSAGILRFPDAQFDMVRPGIGLYGISSDPSTQPLLQQVFRLKTVVSQVKTIRAGESVGYNRSFVASRDTVIATIAIGYADGFSRKLGNGLGSVRIRDKYAPVAGDVCMDMLMADVTGISGVSVGDEVVIFDEDYPVMNLARQLNTIPYEILTGISARVKRVYLNEN
jgi:Alr-MurF fusion protein